MITLIACIDQNDGLGDENGNLLYDLPKDRKFFQSITTGKHVVMGRKTWESLPKKPLAKRKNFVVTMDENYVAEGATVLHSIEEVLELAKDKDVYIIGGSEIYFQTIEHADRLILTHVHSVNFDATTIFPPVPIQEWKMKKVQVHKADKKHQHDFTFAWYERRKDN
jgi:dihydrofolate reductase